MVEELERSRRELGRELVERQFQAQVEAVEQNHQGCRQRRCRSDQTPFGTIELKRQVYGSEVGWRCWVDEALELPGDGWLTSVKELASALGMSNAFANAKRSLAPWNGVAVSEKTVANHIKAYGVQMAQVEAKEPVAAVCPVRSSVSAAVCPGSERPVLILANGPFSNRDIVGESMREKSVAEVAPIHSWWVPA